MSIFAKYKYTFAMSKEEVQAYRLNFTQEPTDAMLEYVMSQVQKTAQLSSQKAKEELERRFAEMSRRIAIRKNKKA